jgi:hypothetical protein
MRVLFPLIVAMLFLVGCGSGPAPESAAVPTLAEENAEPSETPTLLPAPTITPQPVATEPVASPTATAMATEVAAATQAPPSPTPEPTATPAPSFGQTAEGAFYRGNPDAPVTLIDYSDFL